MSKRFRIGFVMNPVAGLGGPGGSKGSDDAAAMAALASAMRVEDTPSFRRSVEAFSGFPGPEAVVVSAPGILGAEALRQTVGRRGPLVEVFRLGLPAKALGATTAEDTRTFARALAGQEIDLLVFAGGDGTAVDVANAVGGSVPLLGIPTGVKMLSGVFVQTPAMLRETLGRLRKGFPTKEVEVVDLDESSYREGTFKVRSHALARVPEDEAVQLGKGGGTVPESDALADLVAWFDQERRPGVLYIVGAGSTTRALKEAMGGGTPLGVDAFLDGRCVAADADAAVLERLVSEHAEARIILSPTGQQGCVLGRGTAQIAPQVVAAVGVENVLVVATPSKLTGLFELFVDSGDAKVDASFAQYLRVRTDPMTERVLRLRRRGPMVALGPGAEEPARPEGS